MTVDTGKYRRVLEAKLTAKKQKELELAPKIDNHVHIWKKFKETLKPERSRKAEKYGYHYTQGEAYFIVKACEGCKKKIYTQLIIETSE